MQEEEEARRRMLSASPERKIDKIALAQARMKARQSGVLGPGQYLDTNGQNHFSDEDALDDEAELDENYIPEGFRKQATMTIPEKVKRDPSKYFKFMSDYFMGEAQMMYKQRNQFTSPLR